MDKKIRIGAGQNLYRRAKEIIPGGTQLLSKRPEMFLPDQWPAYYKEANGCEIVDLDDNRYLDFSIMGVGSCILGYNDPDVSEAVITAVHAGNMSSLNAPEEVHLAEKLLYLHPWAEMVRYARGGGEAMAVAVRLARAASGKDIVLFCGYHGWTDWYLAANIADDQALDGHLLSGLEPAGVPRTLRETSVPFRFNDVDGFNTLVATYGDRIGAIVVEPIRNDPPSAEFLDAVHAAARAQNVPLVVDEVTAAFRLNIGGAHLIMGWKPDVAVFAKGMGNGHPIAAIIGKREVMEAAQKSFISSTYWTDRSGPAAALATIQKMEAIDAPAHLRRVGTQVQAGWNAIIEELSLPAHAGGILPLSHLDFAENPLVWKTVFIQEMLKRGFLATGAVYASVAHTEQLTTAYLDACHDALGTIANAKRAGNELHSLLDGPVAHGGFQRLN